MNRKQIIFISAVLVFLFINIMTVNYFLVNFNQQLQKISRKQTEDKIQGNFPENWSGTPSNQVINQETGNSGQTELIKEATRSLTQKVKDLEVQINKGTKTPVQSVSPTLQSQSPVKEYYIPLGSSSSGATEWTDLPGIEAYLAPLNYGKIKSLYFEAGLRIPTGNGRMYARLKNVTDNVGLAESEISRDGGSAGMVSSGQIPVPQNTKLYRVQIKSTMGAEALLENARIKIFVE